MGRIAITGGAGFVGTNLLIALEESDHEVVVIDDFSSGLRSNLNGRRFELHEVSITDFAGLSKALSNCEYIFHLAARGSVPRSIQHPIPTMEVNVMGTLNLLEISRGTGASVAFASSSSVYGSNLELPKSENMWTGPISPYGASKLSGEALVHSYSQAYGLSTISYRFFNIFGPWQRPNHFYSAVIPKWIWKAISGESIEVYGNGSQTRDFTYVGTVVEVLLEGMRRKINHSMPINLAFGSRISLNEVIMKLNQVNPKVRVEYRDERLGDIRNSQNDPTLVTSIFPSIIPVSFDKAFSETVNWFINNGAQIANDPSRVE
jgi:UDP-glucose 4-epimerase